MAEPLVSVLVPTHDHGPTLRPSVASALRQSHRELEVLIVGDGMPADAAEVARELAAEHEPVRVFEFEKGERHGEAHRHTVLTQEARGEYVFYLSDDDIWLPDHVETLLESLADADFVAATCGTVFAGRVDGDLRPRRLASAHAAADALRRPPLQPRSALGGKPHHGRLLAIARRLEPSAGWALDRPSLFSRLSRRPDLPPSQCSARHRAQPTVAAANADDPRRSRRRTRVLVAAHRQCRGSAAVAAEVDAAYRVRAVDSDLDYQHLHDQLERANARLAARPPSNGAADLQAHAAGLERHVSALETLRGASACAAARSGAALLRPARAYADRRSSSRARASDGSSMSRSETSVGCRGQGIASSGSSQRQPSSSSGCQ